MRGRLRGVYFLQYGNVGAVGGAASLFAIAAAVEPCALPLCAVAGRRLASAQAARPGVADGGAPPGSA